MAAPLQNPFGQFGAPAAGAANPNPFGALAGAGVAAPVAPLAFGAPAVKAGGGFGGFNLGAPAGGGFGGAIVPFGVGAGAGTCAPLSYSFIFS